MEMIWWMIRVESEEEVLKNRISCGLILKASLEEFKEIKRKIMEEFPGVHIVYQKSEASPLWIIKKDDREKMMMSDEPKNRWQEDG